jgi:acyl-CoA synthetase (AMP-forming)/AMP-acid ligase II
VDDPAEFLFAVFGALRAGASISPLPERWTAASTRKIVRSGNLKALIADQNNIELLRNSDLAALPLLPVKALLAPLDEHPNAAPAAQSPATAILAQQPMTILYSSGTTADPKGVIHTHAARCHTARTRMHDLELDSDSRALITAPLYTARALSAIFCTVFAGGTSIISPRFDPRAFRATVAELKPTSLSLVPTQFSLLLQDWRMWPQALSDCKFVMCTGSLLNRQIAAELFELLPHNFVEGYGSTETELVALLPRRAPVSKRCSVGRPIRDVEIRIVSESDGSEVKPGHCGEIVVRTPSLFAGYTHAEDMENVFWSDPAGGRFYKTGDLGSLDADGYLWLSGRKKDMIITAGFNIFPSDLEAVLLEHPAVMDAAVVGMQAPTLGETPVAFVVLRADAQHVDTSQICRWANARLNKNQRLYRVLDLDEIPRNPAGKTEKNELRRIASAQATL